MTLVSAVVFYSVFAFAVSIAHASWIKDIVSPDGIRMGNGLTAKLCDNKDVNASFLDRVSLSVDYGDVGVSLGKKPRVNDLDISFHVNEVAEGRHKKKDMTLPFLIGFKAASMVTAILGGTKLLVLKALVVAKIALLASGAMLMKKIFQADNHAPAIEIEHHGSEHMPIYAEYGTGASAAGVSGADHQAYQPQPSASSHYYAYNNYAPSAAATDPVINYSTVEAAQGNGTVVVNQPAIKRRDSRKKLKIAPTILTIRRYSVET